MARNDSEQVKYDQKVPWIKRAQNIKAMKTNKEIKAKNKKIQECLTKKPLSAAKPLQKQAEDNTSKQRFRTYFSSESLQRKEKRADVSSQVVDFLKFFFCNYCYALDLQYSHEKLFVCVTVIILSESDSPVLWISVLCPFCPCFHVLWKPKLLHNNVEFIVVLQMCLTQYLLFYSAASKFLVCVLYV